MTLVLVAALIAVGTGLLIRAEANNLADDVKAGRPIEPFRLPPFWGGVEVLSVRGDPVQEIQLVDPQKNPELKTIIGEVEGRLFYLGQSGSVSVFYDSVNQRPVRVPSSLIVIQTSNCETSRSRDSICAS